MERISIFLGRMKIYACMGPVAMLFLFSSCKLRQTYHSPEMDDYSKLYRNVSDNDTSNLASLQWRKIFKDTLLQALIQKGIDHNLDLKTAATRILQAEANFKQSQLSFLPSLSINASAEALRPNAIQSTNTRIYELFAGASWEADIWGKLRSSKRAALASLLQSDAYKQAVQTQLIANIATNYFALQAYDEQLKLTLATLNNRKKDAETMKLLKESDVVTGAAVVQSQANRYSVEVTIPDIENNIQQTENAISILLGQSPAEIKRDSLFSENIKTQLNIGVPAQLLANRPDVREAEYQLRNSFELVNVAHAYFYPTLTITSQVGFSSNNLNQFFSTSTLFANILGGLTQPILNNGLNVQRLKIAQAQQEASLIAFKQSVLNAGLEVSNALYSYQTASKKTESRRQQIAYLQKSVDYTKQLLKYTSSTNYTDVLTSEQSLLAAQLSSISDKLQQLQSIVELYRSLGGGWR